MWLRVRVNLTQLVSLLFTTYLESKQDLKNNLLTGIYNAFTKDTFDYGTTWVPGECIRVNRGKFRKYLLNGLTVRWGCKLTHYEVIDSGLVRVFFEDGSVAIGNILVGADGLQSRGEIRRS